MVLLSKSTPLSSVHWDVLQPYLPRLYTLTNVTQADFSTLYVTTLNRFFEYVSESGKGLDDETIKPVLENIINALKKRRGHLLPLNADSEVVFREQEVWTYAVFTAALLNFLDGSTRFLLAKALLPKSGYDWLYRHAALFKAWARYLKNETSNTVFHVFIEGQSTFQGSNKNKEKQKAVPLEKNNLEKRQPEYSTDNNDHLNLRVETPSKHPNTDEKNDVKKPKLPKDTVIETITIREAVNPPAGNEMDSALENKKHLPLKIEADTESIKIIKINEFWRWLNTALQTKMLSINEKNSAIQIVQAGALLCVPSIIDLFLKSYCQSKQSVVNPKHHNQPYRQLVGALKQHSTLIRNAQGGCVHTYCWGRWEERDVVSGVVVPAKELFNDSSPLSINSNLLPDPATI